MRSHTAFQFAISALLLTIIASGCGPRPIEQNATSVPIASDTAAAPAAPAATVSSTTAAGTPAAAPVASTGVLYQDDFTDPSTGWPEAKFDNYFIGYHEPEYYHIEVDAANSRASIFMPGKKSFGDATLQVKGQVNSKKTAANGDFIWGIAFRRSGDQYYAFVISPRGQKWLLLKSSPSALTTLAQGTDSSLHAADADDLLRVDAKGSTFSLEVNGRLVAQVTDSDYTSGEVGFYVQSYDIQQVHIHFDELTLSDFEAPWVCHVATTTGLNLHSTPGSGSFVVSLSPKEALQPLGHSLDDKWVYVRVQTSGETGWVSNSDRLITCNADIAGFPIIVP